MKVRANALGPEGMGVYDLQWSAGRLEMRRADGESDSTVIPGFVDIHIHGAYGLDFMTASTDEMIKLCEDLAKEGYEGFLPTTVTSDADSVRRALRSLPSHPMILGFHLEGPFISDQYPGAQPPSLIADIPVDGEWSDILEDRRLRVITLAPEKPGALSLIKRLAMRGVAVSMGHSAATFEEAAQGAAAGATHATHTFNAMKGFHHREAGLAGYALLDDNLYTELIYDRIHVSLPSARLLLKSKPADKVVAVSDSTMATRMPAGSKIKMWGLDCVTSPGQVRLAGSGALAGSAITLLDAFRNMAADFGLEAAIRACCVNPRLSIGLDPTPSTYLHLSKDLMIAEVLRRPS